MWDYHPIVFILRSHLKKLLTMLLGGKSFIRKTHYDILSIKEDATYDEIRARYRAAILDTHPDKLQGKLDAPEEPHQDLQERFLQVQNAWEILGNPESRLVYDSELRALRQDSEVADIVKMEDMTVEDDGDAVELFYQCRCGDYFSVTSAELVEMGFSFKGLGKKDSAIIDETLASVVLPCGSCSLKIRLIMNTNDSA